MYLYKCRSFYVTPIFETIKMYKEILMLFLQISIGE